MSTVKMQQHESRRREGSVLMVTLFVALGLGVVLASYLLLIRAQYVSVVRSQAWHSALTMAEAGVEEALAQLNTTNKPPTSGWASSRSLIGGSYSVNYAYTPSTAPTIYATGYTTVPTLSATIMRVVEAKTIQSPLFSVGAAVAGAIKLNGKNLTADSYDSTSHPYDTTRLTENGDVASAGGITNFGIVDIHGRFFLGATSTSTGGPNFSVTRRIHNDFNTDFAEILPPFENPNRTLQASSNYTYVLSNNLYQTNLFNGSLNVTGDAVLYVTGDANITNLDIASGASLKLYVGGGNTTLGQVTIAEDPPRPPTPDRFQYYGLPGNSNITITSSDKLIGTIYAPNASFQAGDSFETFELQGAIVVDAIDMGSHFKLYYDESLKKVPANGSPARSFVVTSWQELPPPP